MKRQLIEAIQMFKDYNKPSMIENVRMTKCVYKEFKKKGEIFNAVNRVYEGLSLAVAGKKGRATKDLPEGQRYYTISW